MSAILDIWPRKNLEWWDMMAAIHAHMGDEKFPRWLATQLASWDLRAAVIETIAWNDHNSEFALDLHNILRTRKIGADDEPVTAELVAEAVNQMTM